MKPSRDMPTLKNTLPILYLRRFVEVVPLTIVFEALRRASRGVRGFLLRALQVRRRRRRTPPARCRQDGRPRPMARSPRSQGRRRCAGRQPPSSTRTRCAGRARCRGRPLVAYRSATLEAEARELATTNAEVQGELLYLPALALGKPTTFGCPVREGREHARGRYRVRSLDAEGAVNDGSLVCRCVHQVLSLFLVGCPVVWSSSASMSPKRSSRRSHSDWRSAIHSAATLSPVGSIRQVRTRPTFCVRTTPLRSSTWRC